MWHYRLHLCCRYGALTLGLPPPVVCMQELILLTELCRSRLSQHRVSVRMLDILLATLRVVDPPTMAAERDWQQRRRAGYRDTCARVREVVASDTGEASYSSPRLVCEVQLTPPRIVRQLPPLASLIFDAILWSWWRS
jgi:hypothetical protein